MRKKRIIEDHPVQPDLKFDSALVTELRNKVMRKGKAGTAIRIVYQAAEEVENLINLPFVTVLEGAVVNVKPSLETRSRKWGATNQRIPVKVEEKRGTTLALRWIVESAKAMKSSNPMFKKLAKEIVDDYNKSGEAFKKKENIHKEAMGNMYFGSVK